MSNDERRMMKNMQFVNFRMIAVLVAFLCAVAFADDEAQVTVEQDEQKLVPPATSQTPQPSQPSQLSLSDTELWNEVWMRTGKATTRTPWRFSGR